MAQSKHSAAATELKQILRQNPDWLKPLVESVLQQVLEAEMDDCVGDGKSERTSARTGYRSGPFRRTLITRVGKIELQVPQCCQRVTSQAKKHWSRPWPRCMCKA